MRMRLVLLCSLLWVQLAWAQPLVIKRVTVIDATGKPAQPDMTVVIAGDRIAEISPGTKAKIPNGAQVVDGTGKFLIPGLWDMHAHSAANARTTWSYLLYLANGVVGVRDMNGPSDANAWRAQHAAFDRPSPSIYLGGPIIDGPRPMSPNFVAIASEAQGREVVAQQQQRGADFIKVYSFLPRDIYFAIAGEARKRGIPFVGHVPIAVRAAEASAAGQKSIEHLTQVAAGCSTQEEAVIAQATAMLAGPPMGPNQNPRFLAELRSFEAYENGKAQALFAQFVKNGTWQCPTLTSLRIIPRLNDAQFVDDDRLKYVPQGTRSYWRNARNDPLFKDMTSEGWTAVRRVFNENMRLVGRMHRAGVSILAGTDVLWFYCFPGFSLHDELALLVEAGLSPMAALQSSTSNAARFMGQFDRRGTIETGKLADLVLLDKDPLADIHNTRSIQAVVLNGRFMPRATLDAMLAEAEALANK
jgi:imidazolonepropionase-like amidohydrolase